jgi:hypothetical protein
MEYAVKLAGGCGDHQSVRRYGEIDDRVDALLRHAELERKLHVARALRIDESVELFGAQPGEELSKLGFSRQGNRKAEEGSNHPDRDAQLEYINATVIGAQERQQVGEVAVEVGLRIGLPRHEGQSP